MSEQFQEKDLVQLLEYLRESRGFDFSGYKRTTLLRRIGKRMAQVHVPDYIAYLDYLQVHPEEFTGLFNTILINVTSYFRDESAWEFLKKEILPRIIAGKQPHDPVRVWCAGVASGEEAYSVAILWCEALGPVEYRERVKIYATDVDEDALSQARQGRADEKALAELPAELRDRYFEADAGGYLLRNDLRRSIIFGRHDLVQDAPISRIDLLICRNTLMYFEAETQAKILARLHYALNDKGHLFLGKAEMLLRRDSLFAPVDLKHRIFIKVPKVTLRERLVVMAQEGNVDLGNHATQMAQLREVVADALPVALLVVDPSGFVISISERARSTFGLTGSDVGRLLQDLEISYQPLELRSMIDQACRGRRAVATTDVERSVPGAELQHFDVEVMPLIASDETLLGASIAFTDVTDYNRLYRELERSKQALETASEELQSTNEELETTNEELQSTVEELETTNEELQSSNEELETMNEELESTNTELQAINTELEQRGIQLDQVNSFLEEIMANLELGVAVLDGNLRVRLWNRRAEDLWGVRASETVGQLVLTLDIGLPVAELAGPIQDCLNNANGHTALTVKATNRRGRTFTCRVHCTTMAGADRARGLILLMEPVESPSGP